MTVFDSQESLKLNELRLAHLSGLGIVQWIAGSRVLEVGAGVGHLTHFFEDLGCKIISTDGRQENVDEHLKRHPGRKVKLVNLMDYQAHHYLGSFHIVFFYGTLYHLKHPARAIHTLADICTGAMLIETLVSGNDNGLPNEHTERWGGGRDQSLDSYGCIPSRSWMISTLGHRFEHVIEAGSPAPHREVFIASHFPLEVK